MKLHSLFFPVSGFNTLVKSTHCGKPICFSRQGQLPKIKYSEYSDQPEIFILALMRRIINIKVNI